MTKTLLPLCTALLLFPATALAAPSPNDGSYINDEGARVSEEGDVRTVVIEDGDDIAGETLAPGGVNVNSRRANAHKSLISIRGEFLSQLIELSADI